MRGAMPRVAWDGLHAKRHALQRAWAGGAASPLRTAPPLKSILGHFGNALRRHHPCLRRHNAIF